MYHSWFSYTGNVDYNGKPTWVIEPLYPYYVSGQPNFQIWPSARSYSWRSEFLL